MKCVRDGHHLLGRAHLQVGVQLENEMMVMSWKRFRQHAGPSSVIAIGGTVLLLVVVVFLALSAETGSQ